MPVSRINKKRIFSENQSRRNSMANKIKNPSNIFAPYLTMPRTQDILSNNDSTNQSTSGAKHPVQHNSANGIDASFYHNSETCSEGTKSTQNYVTLKYSSDNSSIIQTRPVKRRKMPVNTIVSISESSNNGAPRRIERASKRIRLFPTRDSNLSSTLSLSSNHANENKDNALKSSFENEITSPHKQQRRRRRKRRRSNNTIPNQLTAQTQSWLILSRHNWVITPSKNNTLRSNTIQMDKSDTRPLASDTDSQNPLLNGDRQSSRMSGEMVQNITTSFPARRKNVRISVSNSPNFSDEFSPNTHHGRRPNSDHYNNPRSVMIRQTTNTSLIASGIRPNANQRSNTRTFVNRQSINLSDSETQNRTIENRGSVSRTSRNPTPVTTPRQNITFSEPTVASHEEIGNDLSADSDSGNSSSSSINELKPVVLRGRRAIFSSDNTTSDSDASSIVVNRARRPVQIVMSDSESEENTREKEINASEKVLEVIHSDTDSETTEKCSICFGRFEQQEVGTPKTCKHCFCFGCIKKWAENNNTCPVDRRTFDSIIVRSTVQGEVVREEAVPPPEIANRFSDDESATLWIDLDDTSDYNVDDDFPDDDMDYDEEYDEDYIAPFYGFDDFDDFLDDVDYDVPEYDVDYDTPDIEVNYDVPEYYVDLEDCGTSDNDVGYDTPDNDVGYDTPDNDVGYEAPDTDEEYNPPDYDGPDEICVVCSTGDGKEMIMCDFCNNVFHLQCLDPPVQDIPVFFKCPECVIIADNEH